MNTPIENRTTPNLDQLSDARQQVVRNLLSPGETLRWVSQPDNSWWVKTPWIWGVCGVATVAGCVLSVLIYQHVQTIEQWVMFKDFPSILVRIWLAIVCFNLVCCWQFPLLMAWMGKRSIHMLTDQRVINVMGYFPIDFKTQMRLDQITDIKAKSRRNGVTYVNLYGKGTATAVVTFPVQSSKFKPAICMRLTQDQTQVIDMIRQGMTQAD
ncbi:MAG: hypothetical protein CMJ19_19395 [Phycisphaeraceae bacterium]|nr:hypothetical protein [Phycisphaeraceae bacterium]